MNCTRLFYLFSNVFSQYWFIKTKQPVTVCAVCGVACCSPGKPPYIILILTTARSLRQDPALAAGNLQSGQPKKSYVAVWGRAGAGLRPKKPNCRCVVCSAVHKSRVFPEEEADMQQLRLFCSPGRYYYCRLQCNDPSQAAVSRHLHI